MKQLSRKRRRKLDRQWFLRVDKAWDEYRKNHGETFKPISEEELDQLIKEM